VAQKKKKIPKNHLPPALAEPCENASTERATSSATQGESVENVARTMPCATLNQIDEQHSASSRHTISSQSNKISREKLAPKNYNCTAPLSARETCVCPLGP